MNLRKMLLLASMALAAVALTAPATAQAQQAHGLFEGVTPLSGFTEPPVTLTSTNLQTVTGLGTLKCSKVVLHYYVALDGNNGTHVELDPTAGFFATNNTTAEGCKLNGSTVVHIGTSGTHTFTLNTWGHGQVQSSFTARITSFVPVTCTYSGPVTIQGVNNTSSVNVGPSVLASSCGNGTVSGTFTAETPDKETTPITGKYKAT